MQTRCDACNAPLRMIKTAKGKTMPINFEPAENGNILLAMVGGEEIAIVLGMDARAQERVHGTPLYVSHFATCPEAARFRR